MIQNGLCSPASVYRLLKATAVTKHFHDKSVKKLAALYYLIYLKNVNSIGLISGDVYEYLCKIYDLDKSLFHTTKQL